ncbi:hypothetical protein E4U52_003737 [Claviceps spartinae]|nr:hypothetical protein E4U52_003737 [Claviceps spartinae]
MSESQKKCLWHIPNKSAVSLVKFGMRHDIPTARQLLKCTDSKPIEEKVIAYFHELEKRYRPTGSAVLQQLRRRYAKIKLDDCRDVADYADQLQKARADLMALKKDGIIYSILSIFIRSFESRLSSVEKLKRTSVRVETGDSGSDPDMERDQIPVRSLRLCNKS